MLSENEKQCLEEIEKIYSDISEWLKFLEAKQAGLFAAWIAIFVAFISIEIFWNIDIVLRTTLLIVVIVGIILSLVSFIPFLNRYKLLRKLCYAKYKNYKDNCVFYQSIFVDIYDMELNDRITMIENYKTILKNKLNLDTETDIRIVDDYIKQIVDVAIVATIKAYWFDLSGKYSLIILLIGIIGVVIA